MKPTSYEDTYIDFKNMIGREIRAKRPDKSNEEIKLLWEKSILSSCPEDKEEYSKILLESAYVAMFSPEELEKEFLIILGDEEIYKVENGQIITDSLNLHQTMNQIMVQKMAKEVDAQKFLNNLSKLAKNKVDGVGVLLFGDKKYFLQMNKGEAVLQNSNGEEILNKYGVTSTCTMKDLEIVAVLESKIEDAIQKPGSKLKL